MTTVNQLNAKLIKLERERDDLVRTNFKLRDKLLEVAKGCAGCNGSGLQTDYYDERNELIPPGDPRRSSAAREVAVTCEDCEDIRELLA